MPDRPKETRPTMDPNARKPQGLASFRPSDETAALLIQLLERGAQPQQQDQPPAPQPQEQTGLLSLIQMLLGR